MARTVPVPSQDELNLAEQWVRENSVEAIAATLAANRWLSNLVHNLSSTENKSETV